MSGSSARLLLLDRGRNSVAWQTTVPAPDGLARLDPVQCLVAEGGVCLPVNTG